MVHLARQSRPASARGPDRVASFALAAAIQSCHAIGVHRFHRRGPATGVGVCHRIGRGLLKFPPHAQAQHAVL